MARLKPRTEVILVRPLTRGRRHKYGPIKVKRGSVGRVERRHDRLFREARYDVQFHNRGRARIARSLPASSLRVRRHATRNAIVALLMIAAIVYLSVKG